MDGGFAHTCALATGGVVECWGALGWDSGQVSVPAGTYKAVSAGNLHTCAVRTNGSLACWGDNQNGQASNPSGTFMTVSAGSTHTCAIRADGTLACWGDTTLGKASPPSGTFTKVAAGQAHTCAIRSSGALACWGDTSAGATASPAGSFTAVVVGQAHSCALRADQAILCWGDTSWGQSTVPPGAYVAVTAGDHQTCGARVDGTVACWGNPTWDRLDAMAAVPGRVDFGGVGEGAAGTPATVRVTNIQASPLTVESVSVGGSAASEFSVIDESCTAAPVASLSSCTISVGFTPGQIGLRSATLVLSGPAPVLSRTVLLEGTGLDPVVVAPGALTFGSVAWDQAADPQVVTVSNIGAAPVAVTSISVAGPNPGDFPLTAETCTDAPVAPGGTCTMSVAFDPVATGTRRALLVVEGPDPIGSRSVTMTGVATGPSSGLSWGSTTKAGPAYTWTSGNALARTVQSGTQRLHAAYVTDRISGAWAKDGGPYAGVYYTRSTTGTTWSSPKRLNPRSQHALRFGLASAGSRVYAVWASQTKVVRYAPAAPRVLYVRVNTRHGSGTAWKSAVRLTSTSGRVDYPTIAATGYDVHIAYTDANTGSVKVASSRDRGATWAKRGVGATTRTGASVADGKASWPVIAASGSTVAVAWLADGAGTIALSVSTNHGVTWTTPEIVGSESNGGLSVAVRGSRIAVAWTTGDDVVVRVRTVGTWADPVVVASVGDDTSTSPYGPSVSLQDPSRVAVVWAEETGSVTQGLNWAALRWAESANGGSLWFATQTLAATTTSTRRINDWPSVVWPSASVRYVAWNGWTPGTTSYRQYLRKGSGSPVGPAAVATTWVERGSGVEGRHDRVVAPRSP